MSDLPEIDDGVQHEHREAREQGYDHPGDEIVDRGPLQQRGEKDDGNRQPKAGVDEEDQIAGVDLAIGPAKDPAPPERVVQAVRNQKSDRGGGDGLHAEMLDEHPEQAEADQEDEAAHDADRKSNV